MAGNDDSSQGPKVPESPVPASPSSEIQAPPSTSGTTSQSNDPQRPPIRDDKTPSYLSEEAIDSLHSDDNPPVATTSASPGPPGPPSLPPRSYPRTPDFAHAEPGSNSFSQEFIQLFPQVQQKNLKDGPIVKFVRTLAWLIFIGGGMAGLGALVYQQYIVPRLTLTISRLLSLHDSQSTNVSTLLSYVQRIAKENALICPNSATLARKIPKQLSEVDGKEDDGVQVDAGGEGGAGTASGTTARIEEGDKVMIPTDQAPSEAAGPSAGSEPSDAPSPPAYEAQEEAGAISSSEGGGGEEEPTRMPPPDLCLPLRTSLNSPKDEPNSLSTVSSPVSVLSSASLQARLEENAVGVGSSSFTTPPRPNTSTSRGDAASGDQQPASASETLLNSLDSLSSYLTTSTLYNSSGVNGLSGYGFGADRIPGISSTGAPAQEEDPVVKFRNEVRALKGYLLSRRNLGAGTD